jgi:tetratricopeptide (TPR) repeat protein
MPIAIDPMAQSPAVDYTVMGSIRRSDGVIRVQTQLLDTRTGRQLWAERYDRAEEEMFAIQDEITARIANALHARIDQQNLAAARRRSITALAAYEAWLRGFEHLQQGTLAADEEARRFFQRALEIDPQFARGYAGLSLSYFNEWSCNAWERWEETERRSFEFAERAAALDPNDQTVQLILGRIQQYRRHFATAEHHLQRAFALAPNDAETLIQLAAYFAMQGQPELGVKLTERSLDLNPLCPSWHYPYAAISHFVACQYETVLALGQKAPLTTMVDMPAFYAAAAAYLGDAIQAGAMLEVYDRQFRERIAPGRETDEDEKMLWLRHVNPFRREADIEHLVEGVRLARALQRKSPTSATASPGADREGAPQADGAARLFAWPIANTFRKDGALWTVCFDHRVVHVGDLKGYRDIAYLLSHPDEDMHCLTLAGRDDTSTTSGGEVLDERARREYQARVRELRAEVVAATDANDPGRATRVQEELDTLLAEISRATGIGGRTRKMGDPAERARSAVTWRIRKAIKALTDHHPALGRHLSNSLQTGVFCRYSPEKPVVWET